LDSLFETLKDFVYPDFFERGPPYQIRGIIGGRQMMKELDINRAKRSVLELIALGYRPATSLAILSVLSESRTATLHGMHIAHELENRFEVTKGWFTKTRYYTDRVGRTLQLLTELEILEEIKKTGLKGKRIFSMYQIRSELFDSVKACLQVLSDRQQVSLFTRTASGLNNPLSTVARNLKDCLECKVTFNSVAAHYCEKCGRRLWIKCQECKRKVEVFEYCVLCGSRLFG
jgi:hypothetical protein